MSQTAASRPLRSRRVAGTFVSLLLVAAAGTAGLAPSAVADDPEHVATIAVSSSSPATQASGNTFRYDIDYQCSYLGVGGGGAAPPCEDALITIPVSAEILAIVGQAGIDGFADAWATNPWFTVSAGASILDDTRPIEFNPATKALEIRLKDADPGDSLRFSLDFTPPNYITPNGTSWTIAPAITGSNFDNAGATPTAPHTATAGLSYTVTKGLKGTQARFVRPGDMAEFEIQVKCTQTSRGMILADTLTVTDTMPEGLTNPTSTDPTASVSGSTVTWTLEDATLPSSCSTPDANGAADLTLSATVGNEAEGTRIRNRAEAQVETIDDRTLSKVSDYEDLIVIGTQARWGTWEKLSFAQLRDQAEEADPPATSDYDRLVERERRSHTTYPGNWNGVLDDQSGYNGLYLWAPNSNSTPPMSQAGYLMAYTNEGSGTQLEVRDPLPCLTDPVGGLYTSGPAVWGTAASNLRPADLCQEPAFHITTASIFGNATQGVPNITSTYRPFVVYTDGSTADMVQSSGSGSNWRNYRIPTPDASTAEKIAMVVFPRDPGLSGDIVRYGLFGYADADVPDLSILKNTAHLEETWTRTTPAQTIPSSAEAQIYVVAQPQIGVEKDLGDHNASGTDKTSISLTGRLTTPAAATAPFLLTDLLPDGMRVSGTLNSTVSALHTDGTGIAAARTTTDLDKDDDYTLQVIDNWMDSGRQLVRLTVAKDVLATFGSLALTAQITGTVAYDNEPGVYANTARVYHPATALMNACAQQVDALTEASEPSDLNEANGTADITCAARDSVTVPRPNTAPKFRTLKTVRGDTDTTAKPYPGIGLITAAGGSATFEVSWKNIGGSDLDRAVIYDILPRIGDTGVGGSTAIHSRGSQFTPTFGAVTLPLPAGVTVEYSQSTDPCRPEVYANQPGTCVDDWSTSVPTPASSVRALRFSSSQTYAPGAGFSVPFTMTTPPVDDNQVAWNSISGVAGVVNGSMLLPNDPPKVGLTSSTSTLPLILSKKVEGLTPPTNVALGDDVTFRLSVTNNSGTPKLLNATDVLPAGLAYQSITGVAPVETPDDTPASTSGITHVPSTNTLTFTDVSIPAGTTWQWLVATKVKATALGKLTNTFRDPDAVPETPCPDDRDAVCASVTVPPTQLTITKVVNGSGKDLATTEFTANVTCDVTVGGDTTQVLNRTLSFSSAVPSRTVHVARGAVCTVVETDNGGAHSTMITPTNGVVTIGAADATVTITNTFEADSFTVVKSEAGPGASLATGPYEFSYSCILGSGPASTGTVSLPGAGTSAAIGPYLEGTICTVTETDNGGADSTPAPVAVEIGEDLTAEFTNTFSAGTVTVTKQIDGTLPLTLVPVDEFEAEVTCTPPGKAARTFTVALRNGVPAQILDEGSPVLFPLGTVCSATETEDGGAGNVVVSADVTVDVDPDLQDLRLQITNTFDAGHLQIVKKVEGPGAALHTAGFDFDVTCTHAGRTYDEKVTLTRDNLTSAKVGPFPIGADCTVAETKTGGADTTPDPVKVTIAKNDTDDTVTATVTNAYSAGTVTVLKSVDGSLPKGGLPVDTFEAKVTCTTPGSSPQDFTVELRDGAPTQITRDGAAVRFPLGTTCEVKETRDGGATKVAVGPPVTVGRDAALQNLSLAITNTFDAGHLQIVKKVQGAGAALSTSTFGFDVTCTHAGRTYNEKATLTRDALTSAKIGPFPIGADCTVAETDNGGADTTPDPVKVTIAKNTTDDTVQATFTNTFSAGTVTVTKETKGRFAEQWDDETFPIKVTCALGGTTRELEVEVKAGATATLSDADGPVLFAPGTTCWAEETDDMGATDVSVSADSAESGVTVEKTTDGAASALAITVVNTFGNRRGLSPDDDSKTPKPSPSTAPNVDGRNDGPDSDWPGLPQAGSLLRGWEPWAAGGLLLAGALFLWRGRRTARE